VVLRKDGKIELLKRVPLFSHCSKKQLGAIASIADLVDVPEGTRLIREGARGDEFMVIVDGEVEVTQKGRRLNRLGPGDFMGEVALITKAPRNATLTTTRKTSILALTERQFWELLREVPELQMKVIKGLGDRLQAVLAGRADSTGSGTQRGA
jgi:CRP-like cAMP-binding protein